MVVSIAWGPHLPVSRFVFANQGSPQKETRLALFRSWWPFSLSWFDGRAVDALSIANRSLLWGFLSAFGVFTNNHPQS